MRAIRVDKRPYEVQVKGRSTIIYMEGEHKATIGAEMMAGETDLVIYFSGFKAWEQPFENEVITEQDRERIKGNIAVDLNREGLVVDWV